jgi:hypothetical protein
VRKTMKNTEKTLKFMKKESFPIEKRSIYEQKVRNLFKKSCLIRKIEGFILSL